MQRISAWPLRKDDMHTSRSVNNIIEDSHKIRKRIRNHTCSKLTETVHESHKRNDRHIQHIITTTTTAAAAAATTTNDTKNDNNNDNIDIDIDNIDNNSNSDNVNNDDNNDSNANIVEDSLRRRPSRPGEVALELGVFRGSSTFRKGGCSGNSV